MTVTKKQLDAARKYRADHAYLLGLETADALRLRGHGNPLLRHAGAMLADMDERHRRGDYNAQTDSQTANNILQTVSADLIRQALA